MSHVSDVLLLMIGTGKMKLKLYVDTILIAVSGRVIVKLACTGLDPF